MEKLNREFLCYSTFFTLKSTVDHLLDIERIKSGKQINFERHEKTIEIEMDKLKKLFTQVENEKFWKKAEIFNDQFFFFKKLIKFFFDKTQVLLTNFESFQEIFKNSNSNIPSISSKPAVHRKTNNKKPFSSEESSTTSISSTEDEEEDEKKICFMPSLSTESATVDAFSPKAEGDSKMLDICSKHDDKYGGSKLSAILAEKPSTIIALLKVDEKTDKMTLSDEAVNILSNNYKDKKCIFLAALGACRIGKSTLLNCLMQNDEKATSIHKLFDAKFGDRSITKGIEH